MKLSIYTKIGIGFVVLGMILFLIAVSMFTFQGNITPFIMKVSELTFIGWIPVSLIGVFILLFRLVKRYIKTED